MYLSDVNVYVYAHREELEKHSSAVRLISDQVDSQSKFAISELALSGFVRIVTNPSIFKPASTSKIALSFCSNLINCDNSVCLRPGEDHFGIFSGLVNKYNLQGKLIADAYHAALAIEQGCTWLTYDSDYARFKDELRYELL